VPLGEAHKRQKKKNIALFVILLALIVLIYAISMMRMSA
jgi:hypothetical protein